MMRVHIVALALLLCAEGVFGFSTTTNTLRRVVNNAGIHHRPTLGIRNNHHGRLSPFRAAVPSRRSFSSSSTALAGSLASFLNVNVDVLGRLFLERLISSGIPALATIFIVSLFVSSSSEIEEKDQLRSTSFVLDTLYDDLYDGDKDKKPFGKRFPKPKSKDQRLAPKDASLLSIEKVNNKLDSFLFSVMAATKSKALAAQGKRSNDFTQKILNRQPKPGGEGGSVSLLDDLKPSQKMELMKLEKKLLTNGKEVLGRIAALERNAKSKEIKNKMKEMRVRVGAVDPVVFVSDVNPDATKFVTVGKDDDGKNTTEGEKERAIPNKMSAPMDFALRRQNFILLDMETNFVRDVAEILACSGRAKDVMDAAETSGMRAGSLLRTIQERPLSSILKSIDSITEHNTKALYTMTFFGDGFASQVANLREEVTAIIRNSKPGDEVLLILQSPGGTVTGYGLAASQLLRLKEHGMKLTICVEGVAASGGYMMCCIGDRIIASPDAVLGSIGVVANIPNAYERLETEGLQYQPIEDSSYKKSISPFNKVTKAILDKEKAELAEVFELFKDFVKKNRPSLDIEDVATGDIWYGTDTLEKGLCDEIKPVDDVLIEFLDEGYDIYNVKYNPAGAGAGNVLGRQGMAESPSENGPLRQAVQWVARSFVSEVRKELSGLDMAEAASGSASDASRSMTKRKYPVNYGLRMRDELVD